LCLGRSLGCSGLLKGRAAHSPSTTSIEKSQNKQKNYGPDGRPDDGRHNPTAKMNSQMRQQPTAEEGAHNSNGDVGNKTEARTLHD
jgi:hypothetical protein